MRGRGAAAAAENAHAEGGGFAREKGEIFGRGFRVDDAVAFTLGETGVGHAADAQIVDAGKFLKNGKQGLRPERAIGADNLHIFIFQQRGHRARTHVAEDRAFFRVGELRDDGQAGERADGIDGEKDFFDVRKSFEDVEIDAALFESQSLFTEDGQDFVGLRVARLHADAERTDGAGDQDFAGSGVTGFAGDLDAAAIEALHFVTKAERFELEAIGAEGVGLDDLRAGFNIGLVHAKHGLRLGGVHFIEAALRADRVVQHRAHRAIGDENGVFYALIEILNFQSWVLCIDLRGRLQRLDSISAATVLIRSYFVRISKRVSPISTKTAGFSWLRM